MGGDEDNRHSCIEQVAHNLGSPVMCFSINRLDSLEDETKQWGGPNGWFTDCMGGMVSPLYPFELSEEYCELLGQNIRW